jgi:hypothetical protein
MRSCASCIAAGLVCLCVLQGATTPPAAAVAQIVNVQVTGSTTTSADVGYSYVSSPMPIVNMTNGETYAAAQDVRVYVVEVWRPPTKTT